MDPEAAAHQAKVGQVTLIYATCLASILWYDTLSTLPREFNLVWIPLYKKHFSKKTNSSDPFRGVSSSSSSSPLSWISICLFLTVRYVCNVQFILIIWSVWRVWTPEACLEFFYVDSYMSAVVTCAATGIMTLRLSAIWGRNVKVDNSMLILWITLSAFLFWGSYFIVPAPGVPYCIAIQTGDHNLLALYIGPMLFDAIVLVMTITRAVHLNYGAGMLGPILTTLIRDGILYFLGIFTVNLLATSFELQNLDPALKPINATLATIGTSIFSSRIFFRMRELSKPSNRTPSVPPTFADGTNTSNPQSKGTYGSSDSKFADPSVGKKLKGVFSRQDGFKGGRQEKNEHSRHLSNSSVQILTTLERQIDSDQVEMSRISYSQSQKPGYDRQDSTTSTLEKGFIQRDPNFYPVEENETEVVDQDQNQRPPLLTGGASLSRMLSTRTNSRPGTSRASFASAREEFVNEPERISSSQMRTRTDAPMMRNSLRRGSSSSELPPLIRRPSRDGGFHEFGFADQISSETDFGRGPKVTDTDL